MSTIPTQELVTGPPVLPSGPPFNDLWTELRDPKALPPHLWSEQKLDPDTGQMVMQLGTRQSSLTPQSGQLAWGLQRRKVLVRAAGLLHVTMQVQPGPVSRRFQGGSMSVEAFLVVRRAGGTGIPTASRVPVSSNTPVTLTGRHLVECGQAWEILIGGIITFQGVQEAYGELIARIASVRVAFPDGYAPCNL